MHIQKMLLLAFTVFSGNVSPAQSLLTDFFFKPDSLRLIVEVLAADSMQGRFSGSKGCRDAAFFIAGEFKRAGLQSIAGNNGFFMPVKPTWGNVVGVITGRSKPGELIIFSAHYDHVGTVSTIPFPSPSGSERGDKKDSIYNGANDDASGVSAVINLARYFATLHNNERTLLFIAFAGEELGLIGSNFFASACEPDSIKAVINIEMIGRKYYSRGRPYMTGNELSDLHRILNNELYKEDPKNYGRSFIQADPFLPEGLFQRSDNYSFARFGIPAHSIMVSSPTDRYYHSLKDRSSTLDYKLMSSITKAIAIGCGALVDGTVTPSRIKIQK